MKILVVQTAFLGDVILTLPLIQSLKAHHVDSHLEAVVTPMAAGLLHNHPAIQKVISFDKKRTQRGILAMWRFGQELRRNDYDLVVCPHKSLRSAILVRSSGAPVRVGFADTAFPPAFTQTVRFNPSLHEIDRNLELLQPLDVKPQGQDRPRLYPPESDRSSVETILRERGIENRNLIGIAPGSVWFTKRWPAQSFAELVKLLETAGWYCVLVGSEADRSVCIEILQKSGSTAAASFAGDLSLLQSAVLIGMCDHLVTNDSAPMHIGVAMGTPVSAVFGPTIPDFGFSPRGPFDRVFDTSGLPCRPCSKHGGRACPIGTFECMLRVSPVSIAEHLGRAPS